MQKGAARPSLLCLPPYPLPRSAVIPATHRITSLPLSLLPFFPPSPSLPPSLPLYLPTSLPPYLPTSLPPYLPTSTSFRSFPSSCPLSLPSVPPSVLPSSSPRPSHSSVPQAGCARLSWALRTTPPSLPSGCVCWCGPERWALITGPAVGSRRGRSGVCKCPF